MKIPGRRFAQKMKKKSFIKDIMKNPVSYLMLLPAAVYSLAFGYCTIPYMAIAFQKYSYKGGLFGSEWIGLRNFEFFFKSNDVLRIILNTIKLNLLFITFTTLSAVTLAILVNEVGKRRFKKIAQSCYLLPYFLSWAIVSYILNAIIGSKYGIVNSFLQSLGLDRINFYVQPKYWTAILVILKVWKDLGMQMVIYLAAITGFDEEVYEAAAIDGAGRFQMCRYITLPMLLPTVVMLTIMAVGKVFYGDFGMIYAIVGDNGVLYDATDVIDTYVFRTMRTIGSPSQAMAISLFQACMGFLCVWGTNYLAKKKFSEGALF
jgi:putative aldouronate transport system permease protein